MTFEQYQQKQKSQHVNEKKVTYNSVEEMENNWQKDLKKGKFKDIFASDIDYFLLYQKLAKMKKVPMEGKPFKITDAMAKFDVANLGNPIKHKYVATTIINPNVIRIKKITNSRKGNPKFLYIKDHGIYLIETTDGERHEEADQVPSEYQEYTK